MMRLPLHPSPYQGEIYRNIWTCAPSQHLYDDLCEHGEAIALDQFVQLSSGIDHHKTQIERPFQYGKLEEEEVLRVFKRENWSAGRFGDGKTYGVLYSAEDEETSIYEASWVAFQLGKDNVLKKGEVYTVDRRMFRIHASSERCADLSAQADCFDLLTHPRNYSFCWSLGEQLVKEGFELLRTPSARKAQGVCVPIFSPVCLESFVSEYYLKIYINPEGGIDVASSRKEAKLHLEASDLSDPYANLRG